MIEAIASIATAPLMRTLTEEATSQSANPARVQKAAISTPYLSTHVRLSPNSKPVFVVRDVDTGTQIKQFPTEGQIRAYQKAGQAKVQSQNSDSQSIISPEQAKILVENSVEFKEERKAVQYKDEVAVPGKSAAGTSADFSPGTTGHQVDEQA